MALEAGRAATAIRLCRSPKSIAAWPTNSASCSSSARKTARAASRRWDALMHSNPSSDRARPAADILPPPDPRWSPRAARLAGNGGGRENPARRERQAYVPAFALAPACAQVIHDKTLAAAHLGQGLLHRSNAANLVGRKPVALPAGLPLAVIEPIDLSLVTALDRGGF